MRISFRKTVLLAVFCASSLCLLTGCEPSERKVLSSSYYKELQQENQKLEKQVEKLQEEAADNSPTVDEERAVDYLDKIARDNLVRLEVGYADNMDGSEFVDNEAAFTFATLLAKRADLTQKYTPEEVEEMYGPGYEYILYDEDNAVYEVYVYGGNYVVFTDLPNNVYYVYNASALGDAFLHYPERLSELQPASPPGGLRPHHRRGGDVLRERDSLCGGQQHRPDGERTFPAAGRQGEPGGRRSGKNQVQDGRSL